MNSGEDRFAVLSALAARLRLDSGLGVGFLRSADAGALLELLDSAAVEGMPARGTREAVPPAPVHGKSDFVPPVPEKKPEAPRRFESRPAPERRFAAGGSTGFTLVPYEEPVPCPERETALAPVKDQAMACRNCDLCERRNSVVWGEGDLHASVMFIGEGPGRDEDEQGRPFVGRSGRLLTDIIEKGMQVARSEVYITNVVKCRPPGNRDPRPEEVAACSAFLDRQIEVISPRVIVAVGGVAGCALLGLPPKSSGLRGKWFAYRGVPLRVIYHPSYLLRQRNGPDHRTQADRDTWMDVQLVMDKIRE